MRRAISAFLLTCLVILLPTAASPLRVCLLEESLLMANPGPDSDCCPDCTRESDHDSSCCVDLEALPDSSAPQPSVELPPAVITEIFVTTIRPVAAIVTETGISVRSNPIRGPTSPAAYRAVLGIWRL